nr:DUF1365 family protein [Phycicoccus sp. HDW14]
MTTATDLPVLPSLVVGRVHHTRHRPVRHSFTHKHTQWLVDLDAMPRLPRWLRPVATFRGEDHLSGNPGIAALKANVLRVLERDGVGTTPRDRVVMLAHARTLGHVFDPMSAFWVFAPDGGLRAVLVEVHNTYGAGTRTCCGPTRAAGPRWTRTSTSPRSTTSRASTPSASP